MKLYSSSLLNKFIALAILLSGTKSLAQESIVVKNVDDPVFSTSNEDENLVEKLKGLKAKEPTTGDLEQSDEAALLSELQKMSLAEVLSAAKITKLKLRNYLKKVGTRVDSESAGKITAYGSSYWGYGSLSRKGSSSISLSVELTRKVDNEVYLVELEPNFESVKAAVEETERLERNTQYPLLSVGIRNVLKRITMKATPEKQKLYANEIVPLRTLLVFLLDYLEASNREEELSSAQNDEFERLYNWATTTKIIANVRRINSSDYYSLNFGVGVIDGFDREETIPWYRSGKKGKYTKSFAIVGIYMVDPTTLQKVYLTANIANNFSSKNGVNYRFFDNGLVPEDYLSREGVTGVLYYSEVTKRGDVKDKNLYFLMKGAIFRETLGNSYSYSPESDLENIMFPKETFFSYVY